MSNNQTTKFPEKHAKKLPAGWSDTADAMKTDELQQTILDAEGAMYLLEVEKENDGKLLKAKEEVKELMEPYKAPRAELRAKIQYALWVLEGRGVNIG